MSIDPSKQSGDNADDSRSSDIILYQTEDGQTRFEVRIQNGTAWLSQALMAELYQTTPQNITQHLKALYADNEIDETATCKDSLQVQSEGERQVQRSLKLYSLDAILAVGYRVRSHRGAQFRRWATERIHSITASEKRFYTFKEFMWQYST